MSLTQQILYYISSCAIAVYASILFVKWQRRKRIPYPPGPKGLPLIGNILDIPPGDEWITYNQWSHKYSTLTRP
jgi:hypothetical protein